jgi:hypothetical protein
MIRVHLTLVHVFHAYASTDTPWVAHALSHFTSIRYGRIASVSAAHDATQFRDSICLICVSTFKFLFNKAQPTRALIDTGGATTLKIRISDQTTPLPSHPVFFIFPYLPHLVSNYAIQSIILLNHIGPPSIERVLS